MALVAAGLVIGLALAWALGRAWTQWMGAPPDVDVWTVTFASATLLAAGAIAAIVPALSAASVDPNLALRAD